MNDKQTSTQKIKKLIMKNNKILFLPVVLIIMAGCATSYITTTWKKPDAVINMYGKIMVIGVIKEADRSLREKMENHLVGDLKDLGYNAYSSLVVYGPEGFKNLDSVGAYNKLKRDSVDAVVTIVLLDKQKEKYPIPMQVYYADGKYANHFWSYYSIMRDRIDGADYYEDVTKFFWESNFYDLNKKELIYSVQTQSFDPSSAGKLGHEYGLMIVKSMVKNKILMNQSDQPKAL